MSDEVQPENTQSRAPGSLSILTSSYGKCRFFGPPTDEERAQLTADLAECLRGGEDVFDPTTGLMRMSLPIGEFNRESGTARPVPAFTRPDIASELLRDLLYAGKHELPGAVLDRFSFEPLRPSEFDAGPVV